MLDHPLPAGFLVGASTAAHQIEGNNVNSNWWAFEHREGGPIREPSGDAANSYHRWADDLAVAAELGLNAYRFSIEWARVEPAPGQYSAALVQYYGRIIEAIRAHGMEPVVTLHHFTEPYWFWKAGSWTAPDAVERFVAYVERLAPILEPVRWIVTVNEPNIAAVMARLTLSRAAGAAKDTSHDVPGAPMPAPHEATAAGLTRAHHAAVEALARRVPEASAGWSVANQVIQAVPGGEAAAAAYAEQIEDRFLRESRSDAFVGVQSYTRNVFGPDGVVRDDPEDSRTQTGWEYWPAALGEAVRHTAEVTDGVPILVTENGIATGDDERRIAYTQGALRGLQAAMADGVDVRGYLHWSLLDNYEWGSYEPHFGLVAWDPHSFERQPKPSGRWLGGVAKQARGR